MNKDLTGILRAIESLNELALHFCKEADPDSVAYCIKEARKLEAVSRRIGNILQRNKFISTIED